MRKIDKTQWKNSNALCVPYTLANSSINGMYHPSRGWEVGFILVWPLLSRELELIYDHLHVWIIWSLKWREMLWKRKLEYPRKPMWALGHEGNMDKSHKKATVVPKGFQLWRTHCTRQMTLVIRKRHEQCETVEKQTEHTGWTGRATAVWGRSCDEHFKQRNIVPFNFPLKNFEMVSVFLWQTQIPSGLCEGVTVHNEVLVLQAAGDSWRYIMSSVNRQPSVLQCLHPVEVSEDCRWCKMLQNSRLFTMKLIIIKIIIRRRHVHLH